MNPCAQCPWEQGTLWSIRVSVNEIMELHKLFFKKYQEKNICKCKCVQATITENISLWEGV